MSELKGRWITVRGVHIFIEEGKSTTKAVAEKFGARSIQKRLVKKTLEKGEKLLQEDKRIGRYSTEPFEKDSQYNKVAKDYWLTRNKAQKMIEKNRSTKITGRSKAKTGKEFSYELNGSKTTVTEARNEKGEKGILLSNELTGVNFYKDKRNLEQVRQHALNKEKETGEKINVSDIYGKNRLYDGKYTLKRGETRAERLYDVKLRNAQEDMIKNLEAGTGKRLTPYQRSMYERAYNNDRLVKYGDDYLNGEKKAQAIMNKYEKLPQKQVARAVKQLDNLKQATNERIAYGKAIDEVNRTSQTMNSIIASKVVNPKIRGVAKPKGNPELTAFARYKPKNEMQKVTYSDYPDKKTFKRDLQANEYDKITIKDKRDMYVMKNTNYTSVNQLKKVVKGMKDVEKKMGISMPKARGKYEEILNKANKIYLTKTKTYKKKK